MSFFNRLFKREVGGTSTNNGVPSSTNNTGQQQSANNGSYKANVIHVNGPDIALTVSALYRAVELKAKTISQMEMQYQRKDRNGGNYVPSMFGEGRRMNYLLQKRANPLTTATELFQQMSIYRELKGNSFVYIERDDAGWPINLWLADCGSYNPLNNTYSITYQSDHGIVSKFETSADDVIHWRNTYRQYPTGMMGIPTHAYAIQTLSLIATQKQQSLDSSAKGGRVKLLIGEEKPATQPGTLAYGMFDKAEMQKYADEINDRIYVKDVIAMRGLDKAVNISMTAQDMQMMEVLNMSLDDVARFYATPRPLLMLDTNSHYNDYTNATMEYLQRTIAPLARELEDLFDAKLLTEADFDKRRFHLCEQPLLRMDKKTQAEIDKLHLETGVLCPNEIRAQYDLPSVDMGEKRYVSTNLAELGSEKLRGVPESPAKPADDVANDIPTI